MKLTHVAVLIGAVALLAPTADAGESCPYSTQECLDYMATKMKDSGWVGVELESAEDGHGMEVTRVVDGSPAHSAGITVGDVLVRINGIELRQENEAKLMHAREEWKPGVDVAWTMVRDASEREIQIHMARMPADVLARFIGEHMMLQHAETEIASDR